MSFFKRISACSSFCFFFSISALVAQESGDFRSYASGFWNEHSTWERFDGLSWTLAQPGQVPEAKSSVWIQRDHVVSLNADAAVFNLHINAGLSESDGSGNGRVLIGDNTLLLYGFLRTYRAELGNVPGLDWSGFTGPSPLGISTSAQGMLKVVGQERILTAPSSYSDRISRFRLVIDVGKGSTIHLNTRFRASEIDLVSGILDAHTHSIRCEAESADGIPEQLVIRKGAHLRSSASGMENAAVFGRGNTTSLEKLIIEKGGILELLGENPHIRAKQIQNEGTVIYSGPDQAFILADGSDSAVSMEEYKTLILDGSGIKQLNGIQVQVVDSLILQGEASLSMENNGGLTYTGEDSWLVYRGAEAQIPDSLAWSASRSTKNIMLDNPSGLIIPYPLEITGVFQFLQGRVSYSESGILSLGQEGSFKGMDADKFVDGPLEVIGNTAQFLPIGKSEVYHPVISEIQGSGAHRYTVEVMDQPVQGVAADPIVDFLGNVHWRLSASEGNLTEGSLTLFYEPSQFPFASDDFAVAFAKDTTHIFEARPMVSSSEGKLTVSINPEGYYALATLTPLAAQYFHHFEAQPLEEKPEVDLLWSIRQDDLSESLHIFRSRNGYHWEEVESFILDTYIMDYRPMRYRDRPPSSGIWYYRLEHRRLGAESIFAKVVRTEVKTSQKFNEAHVTPDLSSGLILVDFASPISEGGYFILNAKGIPVGQGKLHTSHSNKIHIPVHGLSSGLYVLALEWKGGHKLMKRFIIP